jgi:uncharacterized protein (DUF608 family)
MRGVHGRVVYDSVAGDWQEAVRIGDRVGVRLRTDQRWDPRSHRAGVVGEHLLLVERDPALEVTVCDGWDAGAERASVLDDFAWDGRIASHAPGRRGEDGGFRPAAAVAARMVLAPGATYEVVFALAWWMPDHVTEPSLPRHRGDGPHDGTRVGHVYERHFAGIDAVATHILDDRDRLEAASSELARMLEASTLPGWLRRWLLNAADSSVSNTVVPADGTLYTLEGMDWHWPMGGLTGTNDQRLSAHPYVATFFPDLDLRELDAFRRLADARGAIPHGNGNCDLGLGTTDVPYGWPMFIKDFLPAKEWTDLTMSLVLQVGRHWRVSGRDEIRDRFWPALVRGMEYLHGLAPRGVPEGGTTYDVWDFPGVFAYSATLYLATLRMMEAMAPAAERALAQRWAERAAVCARQLDALWDDRGFFRTADDTDTIFTAALAGDWCARWAGLDPVVDPERAASHLRTQHRLLIDGARAAAGDRFRPLPWAEARPDGTRVAPPMAQGLPRDEEMTYVWQVISYQACEQLYLGQVDAGMDTLRMLHDRLWHDGNGWSGGLRGNGESVYMTHPALWAVPHALGGVALDVPGRTLEIGPRVSGRVPFFFPAVWGMVEHDATSGATTIEVLRAIGDPVTVDRVRHRPPMGAPRMVAGPVTLAAGTRVEVR